MNIFRNKYFSIVWTILRVWLGYQWISAAMEKVTSPVWIGSKAGVAITGFLQGVVAKASGEHPSVQGWYAALVQNVALPHAKIFSYMVSFSELLVGIGLIFGALTTVALLGSAFMNLNYMLAGATSTNPILYTVAIILLVAGSSVYTIGIDRYLIPILKEYLHLSPESKRRVII